MGQQLGKFLLLKEIATGGMAEIFIAKQSPAQGPDKLVVIKMLRDEFKQNRSFIQMFLNEARIAARLSHPNVVKMFDLGYADGNYFIAMEYVHGENLRTIAKACRRRDSRIPLPLVLDITGRTCLGLHYAHTKTDVMGRPLHIVHCDVSPHNILVSFAGDVKILDFGVSKAASRFGESKKNIVRGKLAYMSPEQCRSEPLDGRSDIFSLGIVLWEAASGMRLFNHPSMARIVQDILEGEVPPPSRYNDAIPPALDAIVLRALRKRHSERFQTARELHDVLRDVVAREGLTTAPGELRNFVRGLFQERIDSAEKIRAAQEAGRLEAGLFTGLKIQADEARVRGDEDSDQASVVTSSAPPPELSEAVSRPVQPPADPPSPAPATGERPVVTGQLLSPPQTKRFPRVLLVGGAAVMVALAIGLALVWWPAGPSGDTDAGSPAPGELGMIRVVTEPPQAEVRIDDRQRCTAPCIVQQLKLDTDHTIEVTLEGHKTWTGTFRLDKAFEVRTFDIELEKIPAPWGQVRVVTDPPGARLLLDGKPVKGVTPLSLRQVRPHRKHNLRAVLDGYVDWTTSFSLRPGQKRTLRGRLPPKPGKQNPRVQDP